MNYYLIATRNNGKLVINVGKSERALNAGSREGDTLITVDDNDAEHAVTHAVNMLFESIDFAIGRYNETATQQPSVQSELQDVQPK